jgi:hypothetical protein
MYVSGSLRHPLAQHRQRAPFAPRCVISGRGHPTPPAPSPPYPAACPPPRCAHRDSGRLRAHQGPSATPCFPFHHRGSGPGPRGGTIRSGVSPQTALTSSRDDRRFQHHRTVAQGYFALPKRGIAGTFHHVSKQHLQRYLDEIDFRYNARKIEDGDRAILTAKGTTGKRLKYRGSCGNILEGASPNS